MTMMVCGYSSINFPESNLKFNVHIAVVVRFSMSSYSVNEAAALVEVAVQISGATDTVQVNISSVDGTAIG